MGEKKDLDQEVTKAFAHDGSRKKLLHVSVVILFFKSLFYYYYFIILFRL